jgi:hypothetical protein
MCEWIAHAQQTYTDSRIEACETVDLRKLKRAVYPETITPESLSNGLCTAQFDVGILSVTSTTGMMESSPLLGMFL